MGIFFIVVTAINKSLNLHNILQEFLILVITAQAVIGSYNRAQRAPITYSRESVNFIDPVPAYAGMTIFLSENCKKYCDKLLFKY